MGLFSFLNKSRPGDAPGAAAAADGADPVEQARIRARRRLVGAVVLVGVGVIGFPMLFETQPRPLSPNTPVEIARRDSSSMGAAPPASAATQTTSSPLSRNGDEVITETSAEAGKEVPQARTAVPAEVAAPTAASRPAATPSAPSSKPAAPPRPAASAPERKPATVAKPAENQRAEALLNGRDAPARGTSSEPAAADGSRFIVQVGAFSDMSAAREARQKVEKLGLKTYTQVVQTSSGQRIRVRVGPFASRVEADRALGKIKSAGGLSPAVYTL